MTGWKLPKIPLRKPPTVRGGGPGLPVLWFDPKATKRLLKQWPLLAHRIAVGRRYFLLELASVLRDEVIRAAPTARVGGGTTLKYARSLRVGVLREAADEIAVGIWAAGDTRTLAATELAGTLLYLTSVPKGAPAWWRVVAQHSPWPAAMLPAPPPKGMRIVARAARPDELAARAADLTATGYVEGRMREAGGPGLAGGAELFQHAEGIVVHDDLAHAALRAEWGYDGAPEQAAWRPAIREVVQFVPLALRHWQRFLETGNVGGSFPYLREAEAQPTRGVARDGAWFQKQLAPYVATTLPGGGPP
jgi:hypothetical protein